MAGVAKLHMVKNANQEKNWTRPNCFITVGMLIIRRKTSFIPLKKPFLLSFSRSKASKSSGGYSSVLRIVKRMEVNKTKAPIPNAYLTESGTTPGAAVFEAPSSVISQGRLEATQVPMPMIRVWTTKPKERCDSGSLSATKARKGSIETLMEASKIQRAPAAIQSADE